jgi:hypothetical protein
MKLPRSRRDDLLSTKLEDEVVIYDPETKQAHSLSRLAVSVWNHSEDASSIEDLQRMVSGEVGDDIDQSAIVGALRKLERANLLISKAVQKGPITRRQMLSRSGKLGAAAVVTPLIASALVPVAAAAVSPSCPVGDICHGGFSCATDPSGRICYCFGTTEGTVFCGGNYFCGQAQACTSSSQCPSGFTCQFSPGCTGCGTGSSFCGPPCGQGQLSPTQHGITAAGITV